MKTGYPRTPRQIPGQGCIVMLPKATLVRSSRSPQDIRPSGPNQRSLLLFQPLAKGVLIQREVFNHRSPGAPLRALRNLILGVLRFAHLNAIGRNLGLKARAYLGQEILE